MTYNFPAVPVDDGGKIHPTALHGTVCNVYPPDMIGVSRCNVTQQIGVNILCPVALAQIGARVDDSNAHVLHVALDTLAVHLKTQLHVVDVIPMRLAPLNRCFGFCQSGA